MRGICNLAGWQWLFILEGLFTIVCSFIFAALFPGVPRNPITLLKFSYFNERERNILLRRVLIDDPSKGQKKRTITNSQLLATVSHDFHMFYTTCQGQEILKNFIASKLANLSPSPPNILRHVLPTNLYILRTHPRRSMGIRKTTIQRPRLSRILGPTRHHPNLRLDCVSI